MNVFDAYISKVRNFLADKHEQGCSLREMQCDQSGDHLIRDLPVKVGPGAGSRVILKEDTFTELGNPSIASCACVLPTNDVSLVHDGRIVVLGPDIPESPDGQLPFGQIIMLAGAELKEEHLGELELGQYIGDRIEGYMLRSVPRRVWGRVSRSAAAQGFCFETLGRALIWIFKSRFPVVDCVETVFVTSSKEDVFDLERLASGAKAVADQIRRYELGEDGSYECERDLDCTDCEQKPVCDDIREIVVLRKKRAATS